MTINFSMYTEVGVVYMTKNSSMYTDVGVVYRTKNLSMYTEVGVVYRTKILPICSDVCECIGRKISPMMYGYTLRFLRSRAFFYICLRNLALLRASTDIISTVRVTKCSLS